MTQTIYLLRHGDCRQTANRCYIGQLDIRLSERGLAQAEAWSWRLADMGLQRIYSSDLIRSRTTADIVARRIGAPVVGERDFREIALGAWEGLAVEGLRRLSPREYRLRGQHPDVFRTPGGETFGELFLRVREALSRILRENLQQILIVGHQGVNRVILCLALGIPLAQVFRIRQDYGALNVLESRNNQLHVRAMNILPQDWPAVAFQLENQATAGRPRRRPADAPRRGLFDPLAVGMPEHGKCEILERG